MDDPNFVPSLAGLRRSAARLSALGFCLAVLSTAHAIAQERREFRLPPVSPNAYLSEPAPEVPPPPHGTTSVAGFPQSSRRNFGPLPAGPPATPPAPKFQLLSQQEPVAPPEGAAEQPIAEKPQGQGDQPPTYGQQPINNSLQFLRTQDVLLKPGAWQFDTGLAYALFNNDFPVAVLDGGGNVVGVVEGDVRRRLLYSPFALRYGLTTNVQLFAVLPVGWSNTQVSTVGTSDNVNKGSLGDLTAGASVHLWEADCDCPDVIGTFAFTAPTGDFTTPIFGLAPGSTLGQGFWAVSASLLAIHTYDPVIVFYGAGYRHLFERSFDEALFAAGEQISYQLGVGFAVNDRVTLSSTLQGFYITETRINGDTIQGTNIEPISLRFAATISRRNRILEPFATVGMTESAPAAQMGVTVTFY